MNKTRWIHCRSSFVTRMGQLFGIGVCAIIAAVSSVVSGLWPTISGVTVALLIGVSLSNTRLLPTPVFPGAKFCTRTILRTGIVLLGVSLDFRFIFGLGRASIVVIVMCIVMALLITHSLGRLLKIPSTVASLIGVGTAICGVTAIAASAPLVDAKEEEVSISIATITLFGVLAFLTYPVIARVLNWSPVFFGTWAGVAIHDTSQVVAAGFAFDDMAGEVATVIKLIRVLFLLPVMVIIFLAHNSRNFHGEFVQVKRHILAAFPWFLLGFLFLAGIRSMNIIPHNVVLAARDASRFLIVMALAGVGLTTNLRTIQRIGWKPVYVGLGAASFLAIGSYMVIWLIGV